MIGLSKSRLENKQAHHGNRSIFYKHSKVPGRPLSAMELRGGNLFDPGSSESSSLRRQDDLRRFEDSIAQSSLTLKWIKLLTNQNQNQELSRHAKSSFDYYDVRDAFIANAALHYSMRACSRRKISLDKLPSSSSADDLQEGHYRVRLEERRRLTCPARGPEYLTATKKKSIPPLDLSNVFPSPCSTYCSEER
ncbi:hypothetical protein GUITHDRAFT_151371 [Guillardia theta CCMP2712]|uniref:Uncharacterized protein n=1 Tax=Guillardia theta (strain CCMP2712) TaxID=905079 RepID=L1JPC1_GUITC|nr:hypothetical protein GUITHDRAFT_151371 [Guillardia theta CCMP2712]EKX50050.1 hypothetical protein GUITHDRAFT_151371 [Guillardia theta CCMP2712]|mmetsp:Transcript_45644/g.143312  ORF Transcript_45644/g.143312 Transcript_45644/m.143312 type:complete len:193 (+) Transcript_45644:312-890(+)|eukprot:XP_005837030.1 hypothetical protein GUITHDRAFT_151371 [Guillardia theta CCMP2712]